MIACYTDREVRRWVIGAVLATCWSVVFGAGFWCVNAYVGDDLSEVVPVWVYVCFVFVAIPAFGIFGVIVSALAIKVVWGSKRSRRRVLLLILLAACTGANLFVIGPSLALLTLAFAARIYGHGA